MPDTLRSFHTLKNEQLIMSVIKLKVITYQEIFDL